MIGDHLEGRRVADAGREEQDQEHREEAPERAGLVLDAEEVENAEHADASSATKIQKVTRPPPNLSEPSPWPSATARRPAARGRRSAAHSTSGNWIFASSGKPAEIADERAERAGVEPAHDPVVLALEDHRLIGERGLGRGDVVHAEPRREGAGCDERDPDEAGVLQPERRRAPAASTMAGSPPSQPNTPAVITSGTTNCTTLTPRLPRPALSASALPFSAFGKEEGDVGHRRGEIAAAQAAQQRERSGTRDRASTGSARRSRCRPRGSSATRSPASSTAGRRRSAP